jgi:WD40 repeat protein
VAAHRIAPVFEAENALLSLSSASSGLLSTHHDERGGSLSAIAVSPSLRRYAFGHLTGDPLTVLDRDSGQPIHRLAEGQAPSTTGLRFFNDELLLYSDAFGVYILRLPLDSPDQSELQTLITYPTDQLLAYYSIFSYSTRHVASAMIGDDDANVVLVYDLVEGRLVASIPSPEPVLSLVFSDDERTLFINTQTQPPRLVPLTTGQARPLQFEDLQIADLKAAYPYDADQVLVLATLGGGESRVMGLLDRRSGLVSRQIVLPISVNGLALHPAKDLVLAFDISGVVNVYTLGGQSLFRTLRYHQSEVVAADFDLEGQHFLLGDASGTLGIWSLAAKPNAQRIIDDQNNPASAAGWGGNRMVVANELDAIRQYDTQTWAQVGPTITLDGLSADGSALYLVFLYLSQDERLITGVEGNGDVWQWDAQTGELLIDGLAGQPIDLAAVSPDARWVVTHERERGLQLWDSQRRTRVGQRVSLISQNEDEANQNLINMVFSPDGTQLALVANTGDVWVYAVSPTELTLSAAFSFPNSFQFGMRFSPDGGQIALATANNAILLIDAQTGQIVAPPLNGARGSIYSIAFRADGRVLAVIDSLGELWLWDTARALPIGQPVKAHHVAFDLAFVGQDDQLVTVGASPTISLWDFSPERASDYLCHITNRDLTPEEWALFIGQDIVTYTPICADRLR